MTYADKAAELVRLDSIGSQIANMPEAKRADLVLTALSWIALAVEDIESRCPMHNGDSAVLRQLGFATKALLETRRVEG